MITKNSDFVGRFEIAFAVDNEPNSEGNSQELQLMIDEFEPKCLITVLGYSLYKELEPELLKQPFVPGASETADAKWVELVNGLDNYPGLISLLVPYIYFQFLASDDEHHTGVGVVQDNPKGAVRTVGRKKAVAAWRQYYASTVGHQDVPQVISRYSIKGPVTGIIYSNDDDKQWSLYKFMYENETVYTNWAPSRISNINEYGI